MGKEEWWVVVLNKYEKGEKSKKGPGYIVWTKEWIYEMEREQKDICRLTKPASV